MHQHLLDAVAQAGWLEQAFLAAFDQPDLIQRIGVYQRILPFKPPAFCWMGCVNRATVQKMRKN
ncbi:MAG: hypothetical protein U0350_50280 [Caldilineaceae bacterium]